MRESTGTKRGFRPGPGRLNLAERLIGYGVFVLLTFLFCVLYLPGPSSAQRARDNVAGVIYETENNTGGQEGKRASGVSRVSNENVAEDIYRPETETGVSEKNQNGDYRPGKVPAQGAEFSEKSTGENKPGAALTVQQTAVEGVIYPLVEYFPKTVNGDNGIFLQYRENGESYVNLTNAGDYRFVNPSDALQIPYLRAADFSTGRINAHPSALIGRGYKRDVVMRITLYGYSGLARITGHGKKENGSMRFYIYLGSGNYNNPVWQLWNGGSFDLTIPYNNGDQLFFAIDAGSDDYSDHSYWESICIQGISGFGGSYISGSGAEANIALLNHNDREGSYIADPVDSATGAHVIRRNLMGVNGAVPIDFRVHYNSLLLKEGPLGRGWGHDYQARLEVLANGNIDLRWTSNRVNHYTSGGGSQYISTDLATRHDALVKNADGSYTLTRKDQSVYHFNTAGQLIEQKNGHGQSLVMAYEGSGRLNSVTEPLSGQFLAFQYNTGGLLDSVTDGMNRRVSLAYDTNRNLTGITDANGQTTTYTYNGDGRVLTATDAEGRQLFSNIYDQLGRVLSQDDAVPGNQLTRFIYDETSQPGKIITTVTDRDDQIRVLTHDSKYQLISVKDQLGNTDNYTYDADGNRTSVTDAASRNTTFTYDGFGNLLTVTDPAGHVTTMIYDERNNLLSLENAAGKRIACTYDTNNNPLSIIDPLGNTSGYSYDSNGLLTGRTSPGSGTTSYTYQNGLLRTVTGPEGNTATFSYDAAGRITGVTDGAGNITTMLYNNSGNLLTVADPLGNTKRFAYDSHGSMLTETDPLGNVTRYEYNGNGKPVSRTDPLNNLTAYQYDGEDRLAKITDARGNTTTLIYDPKGRVTAVTDPLGNTMAYQYDTVDNLVGRRDAFGNNILNISYDSLNNPLEVNDALGRTVNSQYDILNRLSAVTDPLGRVTRFNYDDLNRLVTTADPLGGQASQDFDPDGNRISLADPNNNRALFSFDRAGRITARTSATGSTVKYGYNAQNLLAQVTNGRGQAANLRYDAAGRLISLTDSAGTISYTYDANSNVLTVTDPGGTITRQYDALNRVKKYTDAGGNVIQYDYNPVGNLVSLTYPGGKQVGYDYDAANRLMKVTDWAGRVTSYEYDANSRLLKTTRPDGTVQTNAYDAAGQLLQQKDIDGKGNIIVQYDYTYDGAGNVTTEQSSDPTQPFNLPAAAMAYTSDNRLATYNGQPVEFDADGNMIKGPLGGVMGNYAYDSRNRLVSAGNVNYFYDAENNRTGVIESGKLISYVVNSNAILSQVLIKTDEKGNQTFYVYGLGLIGQEGAGVYHTYHQDRRGSTVALTDISGNVTDRIQYSPHGTMTHRTGNTLTPFQYNGKYGVMTDANGLYHMRARYYSPEIRRFINQDILPGSIDKGQSLNRYTYVNGCPISYVDPFGLSRDGDTQTSPDLLPPAEMWTPENLRDSQRVAGYVMAGSLAVATAGLGAELLSAGSPVITAARELANKGAGKSTRETLLEAASNQKLKNAIDQIYRPGAKTGDGGLADAIRHELQTGQLVGGKTHLIKGPERVRNLENILKNQNLSPSDKAIAEKLLNDLKNALGGN